MPDQEKRFPVAGIDRSRAFFDQRPRQVAEGVYGSSTPLGVNVRGYEATKDRRRGGSRPGTQKYLASRPYPEDWILQDMNVLVGTEGVTVQQSQSGRVVNLVTIVRGKVYVARPGDTEWTNTNNTTGDDPPLNFDGVVLSAPNVQKLWYADGTNWVYYDPIDDSLNRWAVGVYADGDPGGGVVGTAKGALPVDDDNNLPRLIETWRGRTVVSGLLLEPQNVFFSRVNDPTDWDYSPVDTDVAQAVALNLAPMGLVGDMVTSLCPYNDDVLIVFCDHSIYLINGDPADGGHIDLVTNVIGGVWGRCWTMDPYGNVYFVSQNMGVYVFRPGQQPVRISQPIENLIAAIDTGDNVVRLLWDDKSQSLNIFVTPVSGPVAATHYTYEARTGAWWKTTFANHYHNPVCCCTIDGNAPDDRAALFGSWDGFVRCFHPDATDDDGTPIQSEVVIGPFLTKLLDEVMLDGLHAELGESSGDVDYSVYVARTAEKALADLEYDAALPADSTQTRRRARNGTWTAGRNTFSPVRRAGHAGYVRIASDVSWTMERIRAELHTTGLTRRRGM